MSAVSQGDAQRSVNQDAAVALTRLLAAADTPLVVVAGNTLSPLAWLYQNLDSVCQLLAESCVVKLVPHEAAEHGHAHCDSHFAYVAFHSQRVATCGRPGAVNHGSHLSEALPRHTNTFVLDTTSMDSDEAGQQPVTWVVPRLVDESWTALSHIVARWPVHHRTHRQRHNVRVVFVCFVNTDLCTHEHEFPWWVPANAGNASCTSHRRLIRGSPLEMLLPLLRTHCAMLRSWTPSRGFTAADVVDEPFSSTLALRAPTLLHDVSHTALLSQAAISLPMGQGLADCFALVSSPPTGLLRTAALTQQHVRSHTGGDELRYPVALPSSVAVAQQVMSLEMNAAARGAAELCAIAPASAAQASSRVRTYYPVVTAVGLLLSTHACLSPLFVFEFSQDAPSGMDDLDAPCSTRPALMRGALRQLRELVSGAFPAPFLGDEAARILLVALRQLVPERQVFVWSATDPSEPHVLRCTVTLSYEVFSFHGSVREARSMAAPSEDRGDSQDVSTMAHSLRTVLHWLRLAGWRLVHQAYHEPWCSELPSGSSHGDVAEPEGAAGTRPSTHSAHTALSRRVAQLLQPRCGTAELDQTPIAFTNSGTAAHTARTLSLTRSCSRETDAGGGASSREPLRTHPDIWQAALVPSSAGLQLWKGLAVSLPNGDRATVVGFTRPPTLTVRPLANTSTWRPALPSYISQMECGEFPVVELHGPHSTDQRRRVLVLPTDTRPVRLRYPTTCFVSAQQQWHAYRGRTTDDAGATLAGNRTCNDFYDVDWQLPRSADEKDDIVLLSRLPLRLAYFCDTTSLFMALVLREGLFCDAQAHYCSMDGHCVGAPLGFTGGHRSLQQQTWFRRHHPHRSACLSASMTTPRDGEVRSQWIRLHTAPPTAFSCALAASMSPLNRRWSVPARAFSGQHAKLRCVLACLCAVREHHKNKTSMRA